MDAVFALASSAEARRGLYVEVTRARENVMMATARTILGIFGDLLVRAQRNNGKALVWGVNVLLERETEKKRRQAVALTLAEEREREQKLARSRSIGR